MRAPQSCARGCTQASACRLQSWRHPCTSLQIVSGRHRGLALPGHLGVGESHGADSHRRRQPAKRPCPRMDTNGTSRESHPGHLPARIARVGVMRNETNTIKAASPMRSIRQQLDAEQRETALNQQHELEINRVWHLGSNDQVGEHQHVVLGRHRAPRALQGVASRQQNQALATRPRRRERHGPRRRARTAVADVVDAAADCIEAEIAGPSTLPKPQRSAIGCDEPSPSVDPTPAPQRSARTPNSEGS